MIPHFIIKKRYILFIKLYFSQYQSGNITENLLTNSFENIIDKSKHLYLQNNLNI